MHVFVDESLRRRYLLAAACVPVSELSDTRVVMRGLLLSGQRRLHFTEESKQRRKVLLAELCRLNVRIRIYSAAGKPTPARSAALEALLADLPSAGARRLVIEGRGRSQDQVDVRQIARAQHTDRTVRSMEYDHMKPAEEPLLWIADAAAWAYGAAEDWRRRADPMIDDVTKLG
ncbi:hypothetical protein [Candidatus Neomicrothrix sp.]|uniref:hypothetical protein n=1 Tax=Candidatus Neomicrothrix sp. TaxID=2719034 RepID=UPI002592A5CB|nr:hypothetical protein [Candidatus Microthrix sp.]HMS48327.1 hypothetical protein [Candidatus Microthrix sp.]